MGKNWEEKYKWLIDMLNNKFGRKNVICGKFNYDSEFSINIKNKKGTKIFGYLIEKLTDITPRENRKYKDVKNEDDEIETIRIDKPVYERFSLNERKDKIELVRKFIKKAKEIIAT